MAHSFPARRSSGLFRRLLCMLVIPRLFSALVVGIAEMGEIRSLRRVGLRTLGLTVAVSTIAGVVSIVLVNLLRPGAGVAPALAQAMLANAGPGAHAIIARTGEVPPGIEAVLAIVPSKDRKSTRLNP